MRRQVEQACRELATYCSAVAGELKSDTGQLEQWSDERVGNLYGQIEPYGLIGPPLFYPRILRTQEAGIRRAALRLVCRVYEMDTGRAPSDVQELVGEYIPQVPVDPQTGQPMGLPEALSTPQRPAGTEPGAAQPGDEDVTGAEYKAEE